MSEREAREYGARADPIVANLVQIAANAAREIAKAAFAEGRQYDAYSHERLADQLEQALSEANKR